MSTEIQRGALPTIPALLLAGLLLSACSGGEARSSGPPGEDSALPASTDTLRSPVAVLGRDSELFDVRGAAIAGSTLVVLNGDAPFVKTFSPDGSATGAWGDAGGGPGEFDNPVDVEVHGGEIVVLDLQPGANRLVRYDRDGRHVGDRSLTGHTLVSDVAFSDSVPVVMVQEMGESTRALVDAGPDPDTLLAYHPEDEVELRASEGPVRQFGVLPPFRARPAWTALPGGRVALWDGDASRIGLVDLTGEKVGEIVVPDLPAVAVSDAAVDRWLREEFPENFLGRQGDPLRVMREKARNEIQMPDAFPPIMELRSTPAGDVWARRSTAGGGEIWTRLAGPENAAIRHIRLRPGRHVEAFGNDVILASTRASLGIPVVEVYASPVDE